MALSTWNKLVSISPLNKIWKYVKFWEDDVVLDDFMDYCWFYGSWSREKVITFLSSDNGGSIVIDNKLVLNNLNWIWPFRAMVSVAVYWIPVNIIQLREIKIWWKIVLDVDVYGKCIKLIRENNLRPSLYKLFVYYLGMDDIIITRADYTVDCMKMNFNKANTLKFKVSWTISNWWVVRYKTFGKKWHDSALFLRYYDKKHEIESRWTSYLYPEYSLVPNVMRYELQVNSKGFDKWEREISIDDLFWFLTLDYDVSLRYWKHEKFKKDDSVYCEVMRWLQELKRKKYIDDLLKIRFYLENLEILKDEK